ncbi:MAG: hypothetical protein-putative related to sulfatases [uncultured Phycisphaerae bacterium]|uniref:Sulfatase n=1 Tax=uncultured Phycisphaerae bacterium TaxID=904963 RepID=A0A6J4NJN7_9BACT|nr:MAG: hypothetical protein-putative related to sulfatases [uncultured Phycisphaerae bacterium]
MSHCGNFQPRPLSRRQMLSRCANGFGAMALTALLGDRGFGAIGAAPSGGHAGAAAPGDFVNAGSSFGPRVAHFAPKAKSVIFLYMDGGPSQVDTFDPKPRLTAEHGQPFKMKREPTQFNDDGNTLGCPWKFKQHGGSGMWVSDLFPHVAQVADELAVVRSMTSNFSEHTAGNYFLHTGSGMQGRPSMGAWVNYGLGSESQNLPGFVVLNGGLIPPGGLDNFNSGFLPATYQGSIFKPTAHPVANIRPTEHDPRLQQGKLALMRKLDAGVLARAGADADPLESAIANYELAFRMQSAVPELMDTSGESEATKKLYGFDAEYPQTRTYAAQCLVARRLVERGVRFVELTCPSVGHDRWDQHSKLKEGHENNARATDQPIAGLLRDLKSRGLLDSTLVLWAGEFGRTPFAQGSDGRDHNPFGFSVWMAGAGIKGGTVYGETDEYGYKVVDGKCQMHDLHATVLHLLGVEHTKQTFRWGGRDMRLTDVHGELITAILA